MEQEFRIGAWRVLPDRDQIVGPDGPAHIEPRAMQVLAYLAHHVGRVVTREELLEAVWGEKFIADEALTNAVVKLRKALGDDPKAPQYIQTVPRSGYRLTATALDDRRNWRWLWPTVTVAVGALLILAVRGRVNRPPSSSRERRPLPVPVTSYPGDEYLPALSPEGGRVVFLMKGDLYVQGITGGEALRLTNTPAAESSPTWTPDGQQISFLRRTGAGAGVFLVPALGGAEALVTMTAAPQPDDAGMSWSPDGRTLAYVDRDMPRGPTAIFLLDTVTGERARFTQPPEHDMGDRRPVFSPRGDRLAFVRMTTRWYFSDIYCKDVKAGEEVRLTSDNLAVPGLDWTADGGSLVFSSDRGGRLTIYRVPSSGGEVTEVPGVEGIAHSPSVSRHGARLVYGQTHAEANIWRAPGPRGDGASRKLFGSTRQDRLPLYSPDGTKIAFTSDRTGHGEIWVCDSDGRHPVRLTRFEAFAAHASWSPDGRSLLFHARLGHQLDVYRIDIDTTVPVRITDAESNDAAPSWSRNGRWIYFNSDRSGSHQVWRMTAEGDDPVQLTRNGGVTPVESFDGRFVYYAVPERAGVWRVPSDGGEEERVIAETRSDWWSLTEDGIAFFNDSTETFEFYEFQSGRRTAFGRPSGPLWSGVSLSPDGRWFLYAQDDGPGDDIVMLEGLR